MKAPLDFFSGGLYIIQMTLDLYSHVALGLQESATKQLDQAFSKGLNVISPTRIPNAKGDLDVTY
jgi:hypothetical protein